MRQKCTVAFIAAILALSLTSCVEVKVSDPNGESSQTETTSTTTVAIENQTTSSTDNSESSVASTNSESASIPTAKEIEAANNMSKLIEKYGSVKITHDKSSIANNLKSSTVIYKENGEYISYTEESLEGLNREYIYYKGKNISTVDGTNDWEILLNSSSVVTTRPYDDTNIFDGNIFMLSDDPNLGITYSVADNGTDYILKENREDIGYIEYVVKKDDLRICKSTPHFVEDYSTSDTTIEYGVETKLPSVVNDLNGPMKTVKYIYNYGKSDEFVDTFQIPATWRMTCTYNFGPLFYSNPECTVPFEYPGHNKDYTVYVVKPQ